MRVALVFVTVAVSIALTSAALTCLRDEEKCEKDECCVKIGPVGRCKKMKDLDERCEMRPGKHLLFKHMYLLMCPCGEGMECVAKDGLIGKVLGTCQDEITDPETPEE